MLFCVCIEQCKGNQQMDDGDVKESHYQLFDKLKDALTDRVN